MRVRFYFLLFCLMFAFPIKAGDIFWLTIYPVYGYKDFSKLCHYSSTMTGKFHFSAEIENEKLQRVVLSNFPYKFPYEPIYHAIELPQEQIQKIKLFKDFKGRYWLKSFPIEESVLKWILFRSTEKSSHCPLPQQLQSISPSPTNYEFETEGLEEGIWVSYSKTFEYTGYRVDGNPFEAKLKLVQREYSP